MEDCNELLGKNKLNMFLCQLTLEELVREIINILKTTIAHFTVTVGNEAGVDVALIQPYLLYYVNHIVVMLTSIFLSKISIRKGRRFV